MGEGFGLAPEMMTLLEIEEELYAVSRIEPQTSWTLQRIGELEFELEARRDEFEARRLIARD